MADTTIAVAVEAVSPMKKGAKKDKKVVRPKTNHPTTAVMVTSAIQTLKERGGSSLQAIKKYIAATYKIDTDKFSPFIKKYLKASVVNGGLVQTKGKGASGSFKLATTTVIKSTRSVAPKVKKPVVKKVARKVVKAAKPASPKKAVPKKITKVWVQMKPVAVKVAKASPAKAKKTVKSKSPAKKSPPKPKATRGRGRPAKKTSPKRK